jgi:hypothetical protein
MIADIKEFERFKINVTSKNSKRLEVLLHRRIEEFEIKVISKGSKRVRQRRRVGEFEASNVEESKMSKTSKMTKEQEFESNFSSKNSNMVKTSKELKERNQNIEEVRERSKTNDWKSNTIEKSNEPKMTKVPGGWKRPQIKEFRMNKDLGVDGEDFRNGGSSQEYGNDQEGFENN